MRTLRKANNDAPPGQRRRLKEHSLAFPLVIVDSTLFWLGDLLCLSSEVELSITHVEVG